MGGSSKPPAGSAGYKYYFSLHMLIGRGPVNQLREIRVGDRLAWQGDMTASGDNEIVSPALFGGDKKEGGIMGKFRLMMGEDTQVPSGGVLSLQPPGITVGFRRMVTLFYDGLVCSVNPYPKKWSFRVRRWTAGWDGPVWHPELAMITLGGPASIPEVPVRPVDEVPVGVPTDTDGDNIADTDDYFAWLQARAHFENSYVAKYYADLQILAMNPAHIIYEAHTNREWGRGLPREMIDDASFLAAATALAQEGFGLCIKWSRKDGIKQFVQSILDVINATIYSDPSTAKIKLKLIRKDYVSSALPLYTTDNGILSINDSTAQTTSTAINEVSVEFIDPVYNEKRSVRAQNLASLQSSGGAFNATSRTYHSIPTPELAMRIAQRDLRALGEGIRRFELTMNRKAWQITPGSVFRFKDEARKIPEMVVRVVTVKNGTLTDGKILLTVVQDIFSTPATTFTGQQPDTYQPPNFDPCIGRHKVFEVPYFLLARTMGQEVINVPVTSAYLGAVAERGQMINTKYDMAVKNGPIDPATEWPSGTGSYCGYTPP